MSMTALVVVGILVALAVFAALGWVADSREHEPRRFFAAPHDR